MCLFGDEHHHLSRVARVKPQEKVWLFDGQGMNYLARVEEISKEKTLLVVLKTMPAAEPRVKIVLGQALLKAKMMDFVLQKTTELGISAFLPLLTERVIIKIQERRDKRRERWQRIAMEAAKQSRRAVFPTILSPLNLAEALKTRNEKKKVVLSKNKGIPLKDILLSYEQRDEAGMPSSVMILVGPEGGWTRQEEETILNHGYQAVNLGEAVLRAETAAISAVALISHFWNK